jgi:3-hydroxybutyryl-CoA dehydratase
VSSLCIRVGDRAAITRVVSVADVCAFADITGDRNPVHLDANFAAKTMFGRPIAHGMLGAGFISAVLGTRLPGPGALYLQQSLLFRAPVFVGDEVTVEVEVIAVREDKPVVTLRTECRNRGGVLLIEGEAVLLVPPEEP